MEFRDSGLPVGRNLQSYSSVLRAAICFPSRYRPLLLIFIRCIFIRCGESTLEDRCVRVYLTRWINLTYPRLVIQHGVALKKLAESQVGKARDDYLKKSANAEENCEQIPNLILSSLTLPNSGRH